MPSLCSTCAHVLQATLAACAGWRAGGRNRPAPTPPPAVVPCFRVDTLADDNSGGCMDDEAISFCLFSGCQICRLFGQTP